MNRHSRLRFRALSPHDEGGATLIEMLIYLVIAGLLIASIVAALGVGFRTTGATTVRLAASHNAEIVTNYFPRDVASAAQTGIETGEEVLTGCDAAADDGSNVVLLPAASGDGDDQQIVAYRLSASGDLIRYQCAPLATARKISVAKGVKSAKATATRFGDGTTTVTMVVTLQKPFGHTFEVTGHTRTPVSSSALPTVTGTTAQSLPCTVLRSTVDPGSVSIQSGTQITSDVTVTVWTAGSCIGEITVSFLDAPAPVPLTAQGSAFAVTLGKSAYLWTEGTKTFTIGHSDPSEVDNATLAESLTVSPESCTVTKATVEPGTVTLVGSTVSDDVIVTITVAGDCTTPLSLSFKPGPGPAPTPVELEDLGNGQFEGKLEKSKYVWNAGVKLISVTQDSTVAVDQPKIELVVPCTVSSAVVSPTSVKLNQGTLQKKVDVTIKTNGACSGMQLRFARTGIDTTEELVVTSTSGSTTTWTKTFTTNEVWTEGVHPLTLIGGTPPSPLSLEVQP